MLSSKALRVILGSLLTGLLVQTAFADTQTSRQAELEHMLGNYEPPAGNPGFRAAVAGLFRQEFGWEIGPQNVLGSAEWEIAFGAFVLYLTNMVTIVLGSVLVFRLHGLRTSSSRRTPG